MSLRRKGILFHGCDALVVLAASLAIPLSHFLSKQEDAPQELPSAMQSLLAALIPLGFAVGLTLFRSNRDNVSVHALLRWPRDKKQTGTDIAIGMTCGALFTIPLMYITDKAAQWLALFGIEAAPSEVLKFLVQSDNTFAIVAAILAAVVLTPLAEEMLFRAIAFGGLWRNAPWGLALVVVSAWFAALHLSWLFVPALFLLALTLGIAWRSHGLALSYGIHAGFNLGNILIAYATLE